MQGPGFGLRQEPRPELQLSPQVILALRLLALPRDQLDRLVREELLCNPMLEEADAAASGAGAHAMLPGEPAGPRSRAAGREHDDGREVPWSPAQSAGSLAEPDWREAVREQLLHLRGPQGDAARALLERLDDRGYLVEPLPEVAAELGIPPAGALRALALLRACDPPGIGARSPAEALALQVRRRLRSLRAAGVPEAERATWRLALRLLRRCPEEIARGDFGAAAARAVCSRDRLRAALRALATLDPRPPGRPADPDPAGGAHAAGSLLPPPDVEVREDGGTLRVVFRDEGLSARVRLNRAYLALLRRRACTREEELFLRRCLIRARWLLRALEQRRLTFRAVVEELVRRQEGFFRQGPRALQPLTMSQVAQALGMAASTVSRAVRHRTLACRWGVYPLAALFDSGAAAVKVRLVELLAGEDPLRPLSDEELARRLEREGFTVSRRTVAKYRAELGIPPAERRFRRADVRPWQVLRPPRGFAAAGRTAQAGARWDMQGPAWTADRAAGGRAT